MEMIRYQVLCVHCYCRIGACENRPTARFQIVKEWNYLCAEYLLLDFLRLEGVLDEQALQKSLFHGGQSYPHEKWYYEYPQKACSKFM